jgi:L-iditol 2-dehydrogenase
LPGGLAEFIAIPAVNAIKIGSSLSFVQTAFCEPLGCIIHSSDVVARTRTRYSFTGETPDERVRSVLICGAGPAGLLFTQYLRNVIGYSGLLLVSDPNKMKRELARGFGADHTIDPNHCDAVELVREHSNGNGVEYLIEASGSGAAFASISGLIRKQATVLLYGHGHAGVDLSVLNNVLFKEPFIVTAVGASGGFEDDGRPTTYQRALNLLESDKIEVRRLITHEYRALDQVEGALSGGMLADDYVKGIVTL